MSFREKITAALVGVLALIAILIWTTTDPTSSEGGGPPSEAEEQQVPPADSPGGATEAAEPAPSPTTDETSPEAPETAPPETGWYDDEEPVEAEFDAADQELAVQRAAEAWGAFATTAQPDEQWRAGFFPYLTERARLAYETTPATAAPDQPAVGPGTVVWSSHGLLARVEIPTHDGSVVVHLVRQGAGEEWLVERFEILTDQEE